MSERFCKHCNTSHSRTAEFWHFSKEGWIKECRAKKAATDKAFYHKHKDEKRESELARGRQYRMKNKEKESSRCRIYREANRERRREIVRRSQKKNWARKLAYHRKKLQEDPQYRLSYQIRNRLRIALRASGLKGRTRASELSGIEWSGLRAHLEGQFSPDMSWENYGKEWEIDHRIPLCAFDLTDPRQLASATHFSNLQPLWKADHRLKTIRDLSERKGHGSG